MNNIERCILVITSMTVQEKRGFKQFNNFQKGNKGYLQLFETIETNPTDHYELIESNFKQVSCNKNIVATSNYLYDLLLEYLVSERHRKNIWSKIYASIEKANVLFELKLFEDAFNELEKANKYSTLYEDDITQVIISKTRMRFYSNLDYVGLTEKELVSMQMKLHEQMKYTKTINQYNHLLDILNFRILNEQQSKFLTRKNQLNDLVISELNLVSNSPYSNFQVQKLHLLFQATYYIEINEYALAVRNYKYLIELFDKNFHLVNDSPQHYLMAIERILDSLLLCGIYTDMPHFIQLLEDLPKNSYSLDLQLKINWISYYYQMYIILHLGVFEEIDSTQERFKCILIDKISDLSLDVQMKYFLLNALFYLSTDRIKEAQKVIKNIFNEGKIFKHLPLFRIVRLVNALIHAELGNVHYTENEIIALKRNSGFSELSKTEKLTYKFLRLYPLSPFKHTRIKQWDYFYKKMESIRKDKSERNILKIFNFLIYIESKLKMKEMKELLNSPKGG